MAGYPLKKIGDRLFLPNTCHYVELRYIKRTIDMINSVDNTSDKIQNCSAATNGLTLKLKEKGILKPKPRNEVQKQI